MRLFVDESGSFRTDPHASEHYCVVVGVSVPSSLTGPFDEAMAQIQQHEGVRPSGELKGSSLSPDGAAMFCRMLERLQRIRIRPIIVDVRHFWGESLRRMRSQFSDPLLPNARAALGPDADDDWRKLKQWQASLSDVQFVRLFAWAVCFDYILRDALLEVVPDCERESWAGLEFVVDGLPKTLRRDEGLFFRLMTQFWLVTWSMMRPIAMLGQGGRHHPLSGRADVPLDVHKLIRDGLRFCDSRDSLGIQAADVAASIVLRAARTRGSDPGALEAYGWLMKSVLERKGMGIGLISPNESARTVSPPEFRPLVREYDLAQLRRRMALPGVSMITFPECGDMPRAAGDEDGFGIDGALLLSDVPVR